MKIKNNGAQLALPTKDQLVPGINNVADGIWDKNKDHPVVKDMVEKGVLEIMGAEAAPTAEGEPETMTNEEAQTAVENGEAEMGEEVEGEDGE